MPTYQYACTQCDERLEAVQAFSDAPLTECPACGGRLRKVFSPVGVVFKGSGFYKTDSRGGGAKGDKGAGDKGAGDKGGAAADGASAGAGKGSGSPAGGGSSPAPAAPSSPGSSSSSAPAATG